MKDNEMSQALDSLCELIVDELKVFSANHRCLSPSSLLEALTNREDILELIGTQKHIHTFKSGCTRIIELLYTISQTQHKKILDKLSLSLELSDDLNSVCELHDQILNIANTCIFSYKIENDSLMDIINDIRQQLIEVETICINLIKTHTRNETLTFHKTLDSKIIEIENSSISCDDISELRQTVRDKLGFIKSALAVKKAEDLEREQFFAAMIEKLKSSLNNMQMRIDRIYQKRKHLEHEILIDPLTGIANRRAIERHLKKELQKFRRYETVFSLLFIDIDNFKQINDNYGHIVGDKVIKKLAKRIKQELRETDFIARYGGDEFLILLSETRGEAAQALANRLLSVISKARFVYRESDMKLSISIGLTQVKKGDVGPESISSRVDLALNQAKSNGRARLVVA
jgi:diguanylate cyclase